MFDPGFIVAFFAAAGAFLVALAAARLRRRPLAAARTGGLGLVCVALAALLGAVALNLYTYQRLSYEQPVATISFDKLDDQRFRARLDPATAPPRVYDLAGDQWQLDARVLKWTGLANLLGFDAQYRLQRLTGRYASADEETTSLRTAHDLSATQGLDLWGLAQRYPGWIPLVDASYGSATYLPMAEGARYSLSLTQSGLIARPANDAARAAARQW